MKSRLRTFWRWLTRLYKVRQARHDALDHIEANHNLRKMMGDDRASILAVRRVNCRYWRKYGRLVRLDRKFHLDPTVARVIRECQC